MVAIKLQNFGGMLPVMDATLLSANQADLAQNAWLYSGAVQPFRIPQLQYGTQKSTTKNVYRVPLNQYYDRDHIDSSFWMEFDPIDVNVIHSPTVGDSFERYYWAGSQESGPFPPSYNTYARIIAGQPAYLLGVPAPTVAPGVTTSGSVGLQVSRAYVYTWLSAYGEESAPSPATVVNGYNGSPWTITTTPPPAGVTANRNLATQRIYRTVTATGGATTFFFVAELPIATTTYTDNITDAVVSGNVILASLYWSPPPADLIGISLLPNGIIAGFRANEIWFCEPYRPHAWPVSYTIPVEYPIIGLGVIGQSLIVCTTGNPYTCSGINPASMSLSRVASFEPCVARGSIVSAATGVVYAGSSGLILAVPGQVAPVTRDIISRDQWMDFTSYLNVPTLRAVALNGGYFCYGSVQFGCFESTAFDHSSFLQLDLTGASKGALIDFANPRVGYVEMSSNQPVVNVMADHWTGEVFILKAGGVYWLDLNASEPPGTFLWRSKKMEAPNQRNFAALRVYWGLPTGVPAGNVPLAGPMRSGFWDDREIWDDTEFWIDNATDVLRFDQNAIVRVYADDKLVWARELLQPGELFKLPTGYKGTFWQVEVEGRINLKSIEFATTAKELATV